MFLQYLKLTLREKNILTFIKLNIFPSILQVLIFFILPMLIKQYYIIGQYEAIVINSIVLFLFEISIVFISKYSLNITKKKKYKIFSKALLFAFFKTATFILCIYLFKKSIKINQYLVFLLCFFSIFFFLCTFWLPCLLIKNSFVSSFKKSVHVYFSFPFFTTFVFLHSIIIFVISMILLLIYPGISKITYNMHIALQMIENRIAKVK